MIHPSILGLCVVCQVVEDILMYPFNACRAAKDAIRHSISMAGYSAQDPYMYKTGTFDNKWN